jgi:hypothetical protein
MERTLAGALILFAQIATGQIAAAQNVKPDFTGTWKIIDRSGKAKEVNVIRQTASTFTITPILDSVTVVDRMVYPTDGTETTQMVGGSRV